MFMGVLGLCLQERGAVRFRLGFGIPGRQGYYTPNKKQKAKKKVTSARILRCGGGSCCPCGAGFGHGMKAGTMLWMDGWMLRDWIRKDGTHFLWRARKAQE